MRDQPTPMFTPANTKAAYQLRYHFGWYSHGRQPVFQDDRQRTVLQHAVTRVLADRNTHVLEQEIELHAIRALVSLRPGVAPSELTRVVKGNLASLISLNLLN